MTQEMKSRILSFKKILSFEIDSSLWNLDKKMKSHNNGLFEPPWLVKSNVSNVILSPDP